MNELNEFEREFILGLMDMNSEAIEGLKDHCTEHQYWQELYLIQLYEIAESA